MRWELYAKGRPVPKGNWSVVPHSKGVVIRGEHYYRIKDLHLKPKDEGKENGRDVERLAIWRHAVELAVLEAGRPKVPIAEKLVVVTTIFRMRRPANSKYPDFPLGPPDADKLQRAIGDFLQGVYYRNDSQVWWKDAGKLYEDADHPEGALIIVEVPEHAEQLSLELPCLAR